MRSLHHISRAAAVGVALLTEALPAQAPADGLRSSVRAIALLDSAIASNGGLARLRAVEDLTIRYRGRRWMMYQSTTAKRPWVVEPTLADIVLDFKNDRMMQHRITRYPADFAFHNTSVTTSAGSFFYDPTRAGLGDVIGRFPGAPVATHQARRELPAFQILATRDRPETVRWLGERTDGGTRLEGVSYAEPNGAVYELWFDAATKRLVRLDWVRDDPAAGDQLASYAYSGYRTEQGIAVPTRLVERRNGEIVRDDTLAFTIDTHPADALFAAPATGYAQPADIPVAAAEQEPIRKLAENVWLLQQLPGGNRVMFVAFRDYVLVLEAPTPQSAATAVLDAVRRTVPGKPVRYVTFSHAHDDHGGGLRPYIAQGVTIVTTPATRAFVEEVAAARHTLRPDALSQSPRAPAIETFTKKRVFTDGQMTVELHDIGPTSHIDAIVLAYLPAEKLIFQGDLLILQERGEPSPANALTRELVQAIDRLGLDVATVAGVHGRVATIAELRSAVAKRTAATP
jgi:glyoxylase-like metal-dependent hydrolase (beta-lactamase superfamily II)